MENPDDAQDMGIAARGMALLVLATDCAALAVLALVPLAGPLGLADLEIPTSAIAGWFYVATPLGLAVAGLIGILTRIASLRNSIVLQSAFCACALGVILMIGMMATSEFPSVSEAARMRGFAIVVSALFAMNLLVLWRPAFLSPSQT
jgi:hypothetical protein